MPQISSQGRRLELGQQVEQGSIRCHAGSHVSSRRKRVPSLYFVHDRIHVSAGATRHPSRSEKPCIVSTQHRCTPEMCTVASEKAIVTTITSTTRSVPLCALCTPLLRDRAHNVPLSEYGHVSCFAHSHCPSNRLTSASCSLKLDGILTGRCAALGRSGTLSFCCTC